MINLKVRSSAELDDDDHVLISSTGDDLDSPREESTKVAEKIKIDQNP